MTEILASASQLLSPSLIFDEDQIRANISIAVTRAGSPNRLCPHVKTHKTAEIIQLALAAGISKHKCATLREAWLLAEAGVPHVLIAYPIVGPNTKRLARLVQEYPETRFAVTIDDLGAANILSAELARVGTSLDFLLDLNVGQHRTGVFPGPQAVTLYAQLARLPGLVPAGLHAYDGHNHQSAREERSAAVAQLLGSVLEVREQLSAASWPVPRLVCGGTPTFPIYADCHIPGLECSPGTFALHDANYSAKFADLAEFRPAAMLLTRIISRPTANRLTLDLGYKAVSADSPLSQRVRLPEIPEATLLAHSEEHLVIETPRASEFAVGQPLLAVPGHVCPTVALHRRAYVLRGGQVAGRWEIAGRDRELPGE